jgi:ankyrin repeat protein
MVMEDPQIINAQGTGEFDGVSPMHLAASEGLDRIAALFLRQKVDCRVSVNKVGLLVACLTRYGCSYTSPASRSQYLREYLATANTGLTPQVGRDPMHEAVISGSLGVVKTLSDGKCFERGLIDAFGFTALHYAGLS